MKKSKTVSGFLGIVESFVRKRPILYYFLRNIIVYFNIFEEDFHGFKKIIKKKQPINIIDVGASDGISAKFFLRNFNVNNIYCYEPFNKFNSKLSNLKKKYESIIINNYGISNENRNLKIFIPEYFFLNKKFKLLTYAFYNLDELKNQLILDFGKNHKLKINSLSIKLKKFKRIYKKIDIIKIDVNGHEFSIICALQEQIVCDSPIIIFESNSENKKIFDLLVKFNYEFFVFKNNKFEKAENFSSLNIFCIKNRKL